MEDTDFFPSKLEFQCNKPLLKLVQNLYPSKNVHKKLIVLSPNENGLNLYSCGEKTFASKIVIPRALLIDFHYEASTDEEAIDDELTLNFGLFLEFLQFSLIRDKRQVSIVTLENSDSLSLQCPADDAIGAIEISMEVPLLERAQDEELNDFDWNAEELDLKLFTSGECLRQLCSFLDSSSEHVSVEYDDESRIIKIIAESMDHSVEFLLTEDNPNCSMTISQSGSHNYPFHIFKQIQAVMSVADRVCLRIFSDGLLYIQVIFGQDLESIFYELKATAFTSDKGSNSQ